MIDAAGRDDADLVEELCDECERRLLSGDDVDLSALALRCPERLWHRLIPELLLLDIAHARRTGAAPTPETYLKRYPQLRRHVDASFAAAVSIGKPTDGSETVGTLRPGRVHGRFELIRELGVGSSGQVWEAVDLRTSRRVAVKIPRWGELSVDQKLRVFREGRAAARLNHRGIASLFEVSVEGGVPYLVAELVEGKSLQEALLQGPMDPTDAAKLSLGLARALSHAHERGVVHRDLKPANVVIAADGEPRLTDFGLARCVDEDAGLTAYGDVLGSPAYMAPEQALGRSSTAGAPADIFALGAVLFETLTGRPPFTGSAADTIRQISDSGLEAPSPRVCSKRIPKDLAAICSMALQKRPEDRFASAGAMALDLQRYLNRETVLARRPSAVVRVTRWSIRRRRLLAGIAGVIPCTLLAAYLWSTPSTDNSRVVQIATDPSPARVAFVPLIHGQQPNTNDAVFSNSVNGSARAKLLPGDYVVIAVTEGGRFHEVYRSVAIAGESSLRRGEYQHSRVLEDGCLQLKPISIPPGSIAAPMVKVEQTSSLTMGYSDNAASAPEGFEVASFFVDPTVFRLVDHQLLYPERLSDRARFGQDPQQSEAAWPCTYDEAVDAAELAGKRLLTELEYELVTTNSDTTRHLTRIAQPGGRNVERLRPAVSASVDSSTNDVTAPGPYSGLAEWTSCVGSIDPSLPSTHAIVRGDSWDRQYLPKSTLRLGLAFRAARSVAPLIAYDAMR